MITADLYNRVRGRLAELGHGGDYTWSQGLKAPASPEAFAAEYVWVVLNSGMKNAIAAKIMERVWPRLVAGDPIAPAFKHPGKGKAIERVWTLRADYLACFRAIDPACVRAILEWCESLPWIGPITRYHLAKNLGVDVAKPDRWLERLAHASGETVDGLCQRLAAATGDRVATVDVVLWRACAVGVLTVVEGVIALGA